MKACGRRDPHQCSSHHPEPVCFHCGAPDVIAPVHMTAVCRRCLIALGHIAAEPFTAAEVVRRRLEAASLDVLRLVGGRWTWSATWPATGDARLISGRVADGRLA